MKKILLIGGGGTLGEYAAEELLKRGWAVDVLAPEELTSLNRNLRYFRGLGTDDILEKIFAENRYDAVIDYIYYRCGLDEWKRRADWLLARTDQLVYLSSYRVYAGSQNGEAISETSPLLWDVAPQSFRDTDVYAGPKTQAERYLRSLPRHNWTIVRPLISFSHYRLDLLLTGGDQLLPRSAARRSMLLPEESRYLWAGVGWSGNVGRMFAAIAGNARALGETYTLGTGERRTWNDVADYYKELLGSEFVWVPAADYVKYATPDDHMFRMAWTYDRALSRPMDCSKIRDLCGMSEDGYVPIREGILRELHYLQGRPDLVKRFYTPLGAAIAAKTDAYLEGRSRTLDAANFARGH